MNRIIDDGRGIWIIDWSVVKMIIRNYMHYDSILRHSRMNAISQVDWYNPFSWAMPTMMQYEVDWSSQNIDKEYLSGEMLAEFVQRASESVASLKVKLANLIQLTHEKKLQFRSNLQSASKQTSENINKAVNTYNRLTDGARIVRDTSAEVVLVGATVLSGGAAAGAIAAGSAMKGIATYQDTGSVGAALIETTGTVIISIIPLGRKATGAVALTKKELVAYEGAVLFLEVQFEVAKGLASGESLKSALAKGGVKVVSTGAGHLSGNILSTPAVKDIMSRTGLPAKYLISRTSRQLGDSTELTSKVISDAFVKPTIDRLGNSAVDRFTGNLPRRRANVSSVVRSSQYQCTMADEVCGDLKLLDIAVRQIGSNFTSCLIGVERY